MLLATNEESAEAARIFEQTEGNDIHSAAAVATASLIKAVGEGAVEKDATIMLNITGGGENRMKGEKQLYYLKPDYIFDISPDRSVVKEVLERLF